MKAKINMDVTIEYRDEIYCMNVCQFLDLSHDYCFLFDDSVYNSGDYPKTRMRLPECIAKTKRLA